MSEALELNTLHKCKLETRDQNDDYEAPISSQNAENDYAAIRDTLERSKQEEDPIHNNTSICSGSSECNNTITPRSYRRTQPDGPAADEKITILSKRLAETATALKRLKIICIALGVVLVISSVALMLIMMVRVSNVEQTSEEHASKIEGKLSSMTTDSEGVNHDNNTRIAELERAATEGNSLVRNYSIKLLELEGAYNASRAVIEDLTTTIAELKQVSLNSVLMIQNHAAELLKFDMAHNTSKAAIEIHSEKIEDLEAASFVSNTLIQNYTAKLLELDMVEEIKVLTSKIPELEKAITNINSELSNYDTIIEGHTAKIANLENISFDSNTLILNHTAMLLELGKTQATSSFNVQMLSSEIQELEKSNIDFNNGLSDYDAVIEGHAAKIANLENASFVKNSMILNHTAKLLELEEVQTNNSANIKELASKTEELAQANKDINSILTYHINKSMETSSAVAFSAYADNTPVLSTSNKTIFNRVLTNEHQAYNVSTATRGDKATWTVLKVNGVDILHSYTEGTEDGHDVQGANIAVLKLSIGDEAWISGSGIFTGYSHGQSNFRTSSFSGFLVQPGSAVAFSAYVDETTILSSPTVFNKALTNDDLAYDQSTGVFTCPISGIYMFSFVAAAIGDAATSAELMVNGKILLHSFTESSQDMQGANIAVVKLYTGDEVWISGSGTLAGNSGGTSGKRTSSFSGFLVKPGSTVAFSAFVDRSTSLSTHTKTVFNKVLTNEHQAYNVSTGVFTCPLSGIYMFSFATAAIGDITIWMVLKKNGVDILHSIAEGTEDYHDAQGINIAVVKLTTGDEVWISGGGTLPGHSWLSFNLRTSTFSGFLVQPLFE